MEDIAIPKLPDPEKDPMGWMLWTKYLHPELTVKFERDDGFSDEDYFAEMAFNSYAQFYKIERQCLAQVLEERVLDIGTGAGRGAIHFQNRGMDITALDVSEGAVDLARTRGVNKLRHGSILDVRPQDGPWDGFVMIGNGTTVAKNLPELKKILKHLRKLAAPKAQLVITSLDIFANPAPPHQSYQAAKKAEGRYPGEFNVRYQINGTSSGWLAGVLVDPSTLYQLLTDCGWSVQRKIVHASEEPLFGMVAH